MSLFLMHHYHCLTNPRPTNYFFSSQANDNLRYRLAQKTRALARSQAMCGALEGNH